MTFFLKMDVALWKNTPLDIVLLLFSFVADGKTYKATLETCKNAYDMYKNNNLKFCNQLWTLVLKFPHKKWSWNSLSKNINVTCDIISSNLDKPWSWQHMSSNDNITPEFLIQHINEDWDYRKVSMIRNFNIFKLLDIVHSDLDTYNWLYVCKNQYLTIEYIVNHPKFDGYWDWAIIYKFSLAHKNKVTRDDFLNAYNILYPRMSNYDWFKKLYNHFLKNQNVVLNQKIAVDTEDGEVIHCSETDEEVTTSSSSEENKGRCGCDKRVQKRIKAGQKIHLDTFRHCLTNVEFVRKYVCEITPNLWRILSKKYQLHVILNNIDLPWDWSYISNSLLITLDDIINHPNLPWDWSMISKKQTTTHLDIENHPELNWNYKDFSSNSNVTIKCVIDNLEKPWVWKKLSFNYIGISLTDIDKNPGLPWVWSEISHRPDLTMDFVSKYHDKLSWQLISYNRFKNTKKVIV